jgi:hypothetical protein
MQTAFTLLLRFPLLTLFPITFPFLSSTTFTQLFALYPFTHFDLPVPSSSSYLFTCILAFQPNAKASRTQQSAARIELKRHPLDPPLFWSIPSHSLVSRPCVSVNHHLHSWPIPPTRPVPCTHNASSDTSTFDVFPLIPFKPLPLFIPLTLSIRSTASSSRPGPAQSSFRRQPLVNHVRYYRSVRLPLRFHRQQERQEPSLPSLLPSTRPILSLVQLFQAHLALHPLVHQSYPKQAPHKRQRSFDDLPSRSYSTLLLGPYY